MATAAHPITPPPPLQAVPPLSTAPNTASGVVSVAEAAIDVSATSSRSNQAISPESVVARLPVEVEVGVPVRDFRVRNLLSLQQGVVVASHWSHGDDLPLSAGDVQLAWTQFEVVITTLAARITRIA